MGTHTLGIVFVSRAVGIICTLSWLLLVVVGVLVNVYLLVAGRELKDSLLSLVSASHLLIVTLIIIIYGTNILRNQTYRVAEEQIYNYSVIEIL